MTRPPNTRTGMCGSRPPRRAYRSMLNALLFEPVTMTCLNESGGMSHA